jgi:hypothetical protein
MWDRTNEYLALVEKTRNKGTILKLIFRELNGDDRMDSPGPKQGTVKGSRKHGYEP